MRTAEEFNEFYSRRDPWQVDGHAPSVRDTVFKDIAQNFGSGKNVLELGCGEGVHTKKIFAQVCRRITAVDISRVAIERANALKLSNAEFFEKDILSVENLNEFDVIFALECIYYLEPSEQRLFFGRLKEQAKGKLLVISAPIVGKNRHRKYYDLSELKALFLEFGLKLITSKKVSLYWGESWQRKLLFLPIRILNKLGVINSSSIQRIPDMFIYQKVFVLEI